MINFVYQRQKQNEKNKRKQNMGNERSGHDYEINKI